MHWTQVLLLSAMRYCSFQYVKYHKGPSTRSEPAVSGGVIGLVLLVEIRL